MIFVLLNPEKIDINSLYVCPPHLYTVATLPWEMKKSFSTVLFIHTLNYLRYFKLLLP